MSDLYLTRDDWTALVQAADRAKRGLKPYLSADQAAHLTTRGYLAPSPRDPTQYVVTSSGKLAAQNYLKSTR
jgi:hypothetical protein